jgi:hypothetical protein
MVKMDLRFRKPLTQILSDISDIFGSIINAEITKYASKKRPPNQ